MMPLIACLSTFQYVYHCIYLHPLEKYSVALPFQAHNSEETSGNNESPFYLDLARVSS